MILSLLYRTQNFLLEFTFFILTINSALLKWDYFLNTFVNLIINMCIIFIFHLIYGKDHSVVREERTHQFYVLYIPPARRGGGLQGPRSKESVAGFQLADVPGLGVRSGCPAAVQDRHMDGPCRSKAQPLSYDL